MPSIDVPFELLRGLVRNPQEARTAAEVTEFTTELGLARYQFPDGNGRIVTLDEDKEYLWSESQRSSEYRGYDHEKDDGYYPLDPEWMPPSGPGSCGCPPPSG